MLYYFSIPIEPVRNIKLRRGAKVAAVYPIFAARTHWIRFQSMEPIGKLFSDEILIKKRGAYETFGKTGVQIHFSWTNGLLEFMRMLYNMRYKFIVPAADEKTLKSLLELKPRAIPLPKKKKIEEPEAPRKFETIEEALTVIGWPGATKSMIRSMYKIKLMEFHPDRYVNAPKELQKWAEAKFKIVKDAMDFLLHKDTPLAEGNERGETSGFGKIFR